MFNVGVIAARPSKSLVKLTSRFIGLERFPQVLFYNDGRVNVAGIGFVAGEWYVPGPLAGIGNSYQIRYTHQFGEAPSSYADSVETTWTDINGIDGIRRVVWDSRQPSGRALVEIRHKATQVVQASAQFWTSDSAAP